MLLFYTKTDLYSIFVCSCVALSQALCQLAIDYGSLCGLNDVVSTSQFYVTAADWGKRLGKHKVSSLISL